jgi:hypothetical protein
MSRRELDRSIANAKPIIARAFEAVLEAPIDPWEAILWAKAHKCLRERHFERLCQLRGPVLRKEFIVSARRRRLQRRIDGTPYKRGTAARAAIEILSYRSEERVPLESVQIIEVDSQVPFRILADPEFSGGEYFQICMKGLFLLHILETPDALGLRQEIWSGVEDVVAVL